MSDKHRTGGLQDPLLPSHPGDLHFAESGSVFCGTPGGQTLACHPSPRYSLLICRRRTKAIGTNHGIFDISAVDAS
jgi:hypothetical protein